MSTAYKEYTLSVDSFNQPKAINDRNAIGIMLIRLILLEPGTNPLHPTMGVGIISKYRFLSSEDMERRLKSDIEYQIQTFIPEYSVSDIQLVYQDDKTVDIHIYIDGTIYVYDSSTMLPISLSDIANN